MEYREFLKSAAHVVPSERQMNWFDTEFYGFIHFTVNTYTDLEWGLGNEPESIFNPTELDCDEWVEAAKSAGIKGLILTAKHHDGFCLWQTKTTEHCVRNSPFRDGKGDIVRECADACKRGGVKFGVYLSPWDRNSKYYGSDAYNDFYCEQLTELLTGYGELFMVWFDGACGEGPNGKKQVYDFPRYIELIRKYQPNACIFNDHGPDVRWVGNEAGKPRRAEWAVVPTDLCYRSEPQTGKGPLTGDISYLYNPEECIGDLNVIQYATALAFCGSEVDMSIRPGWFYHEREEAHSLERLFRTYLDSCGANACFNLNIPPMPNVRFHPNDIARLKELGDALKNAFGEDKEVSFETETIPMESDTQCRLFLRLPQKTKIAYVKLRENIAEGQRVESFRILADGRAVYRGYTVGHNKICPVNAEAYTVEIFVTSARDTVNFRDITIYKA